MTTRRYVVIDQQTEGGFTWPPLQRWLYPDELTELDDGSLQLRYNDMQTHTIWAPLNWWTEEENHHPACSQ